MKELLRIDQLEDTLEVSNRSMLGIMNIKYKGVKLNKINKFEYTIETDAGETLIITLKRRLGGIDLPHVFVNDEEILYVRELSLIEKIILVFPVVFMLAFGILPGGIAAALTFMMTVNISRTFRSPASGVIVNIFIILAMAFLAWIGSGFLYLLLWE